MYELIFILTVLGVSTLLAYTTEYIYRVKMKKRLKALIKSFHDDYIYKEGD